MEKVLKNKNKILVLISIFIVIIASILIFRFNNYNSEVTFSVSEDYDRIEFSNGYMYIFENNKFSKYKNGKLKLQKDIPSNSKIKMNNDVIYSLDRNKLTMYSTSFDEIKSVEVSEGYDYIFESGNSILINNDSYKIFDENLKLVAENNEVENPVYLKFSKDKSRYIYTDYKAITDRFKSRFHIMDLGSNQSLYDFAFYNEFIIDFGFIEDNNENIYVVTNEKLYILEGSTIKNQKYITELKDIRYSNGKIYILSDSLEVYNSDNLNLEKKVELKESNENMYILKNNILLTNKTGYSLIDKKNYNIQNFSMELVDVKFDGDNVFLLSKNGYKKLN